MVYTGRDKIDIAAMDEQLERRRRNMELEKARAFIRSVSDLAKHYDVDYFVVTNGASGYSNRALSENIIRQHRDFQIDWEKENGLDPEENWVLEESPMAKLFKEKFNRMEN